MSKPFFSFRMRRVCHICIAVCVTVCLLIRFCAPEIPALAQDAPAIYVSTKSDAVRRALTLANSTGTVRLVDELEQADAAVLDLSNLQGNETTRLRGNRGVVVLLDEAASPTQLNALSSRLGVTVPISEAVSLDTDRAIDDFFQPLRVRLGLEQPAPAAAPLDPLVRDITWRSAPQVRERSRVVEQPSIQTLVRSYRGSGQNDQPVEAIFSRIPPNAERGAVYLVTPWLGNGQNVQLQQWAFFNYLFYHMAVRAAGVDPVPFGSWSGAPVPDEGFRRFILTLFGSAMVATLVLFVVVRRSYVRPEDPKVFTEIEYVDPEPERSTNNAWEEVGFHRPLAGFLIFVALGLLSVLPMMGYGSVFVPQYLLPFPATLGGWGWVGGFFALFWMVFDIGTGTASIKYFSQYRVHNPARAMSFINFFVWWQAITGLTQIAIVVSLALFYVPQTAYAYLAFFFIGHALFQFPGFLSVINNTFAGMQRFDRQQIIAIIASFPGVIHLITIPLGRWWGSNEPRFGEAYGAIAGMVVGQLIMNYIVFGTGIVLYKRLGHDPRELFMTNFDWHTARTALTYGSKVLLFGVSITIEGTIQTIMLERTVVNYAELTAIWGVAASLGFVYNLAGGLSGQMMPAISEAFSNGRIMLCRYYMSQAFKYGGTFTLFAAGALLPVADRFLSGSLGPQWARAAELAPLTLIAGLFAFPAWFSDSVQQGTGRPGLQVILTAAEQMLRLILVILLLPSLQIYGLILAAMFALIAKDIVAWIVNRRLLFDPSIHWWQSFIAPAGAAAINFVILRSIGTLFWQPTLVHSSLLLGGALLLSIPSFFFLNGLFGGWDDHGLAQLRRAIDLTGWARPVVMAIYLPTQAGARLSPLHNRFPNRLQAAADAEAAQLTAEKVALS